MKLSPRQMKLLRQTWLCPSVYTEFGDSDKKNIDFLCELELINRIDEFLFITEKGRAELHHYFFKLIQFWLPFFISIASLIISIIAIKKP